MAFELPSLPYAQDALAPHISAETLDFHHGKHHNTYIVNLNNLLGDAAGSSDADLEKVIMDSAGDASKAGVFNNAAQIWNHTFYWNCMKPNGGGKPTGDLAAKIDAAFGSYDKFKEEFKNACVTQFGSGWGWLVVENGALKITKTPNADTPMAHGQTALLTCDVWEHAYYIDFRNRRPDYVETFLNYLVNWDFVAKNLADAG
ncbi:MAG: superoxide dismutase [Rhodospirillales bacterium]|nr:superoxide dismutase [Rhodospirillales bacterium]MCW9001658.1 superoxide dismutase [Rhodospirillales bacterium]MCW9038880.1 superoxide dismutase [Rhodospirillales bacterium]